MSRKEDGTPSSPAVKPFLNLFDRNDLSLFLLKRWRSWPSSTCNGCNADISNAG